MKLFPLTREGRQTTIYLVFAGSGPILTAIIVWAMLRALDVHLFGTFRDLALIVAASLFVIITGLAMFVSIRAIKVGRDGFEASGGE